MAAGQLIRYSQCILDLIQEIDVRCQSAYAASNDETQGLSNLGSTCSEGRKYNKPDSASF
jgi:hypothetical protein